MSRVVLGFFWAGALLLFFIGRFCREVGESSARWDVGACAAGFYGEVPFFAQCGEVLVHCGC